MKIIFLITLLFSFTGYSFAQNTFKAVIRNEKTKELLVGASAYIDNLKKGVTTDSTGLLVINNIPDGKFSFKFSYVGFEAYVKEFSFPLSNSDQVFEIELEPKAAELGDVIVTSSTRSSRTIANIPTRIETIVAGGTGRKVGYAARQYQNAFDRKHRYSNTTNLAGIRQRQYTHSGA